MKQQSRSIAMPIVIGSIAGVSGYLLVRALPNAVDMIVEWYVETAGSNRHEFDVGVLLVIGLLTALVICMGAVLGHVEREYLPGRRQALVEHAGRCAGIVGIGMLGAYPFVMLVGLESGVLASTLSAGVGGTVFAIYERHRLRFDEGVTPGAARPN